jgi:anaerobic ribonucleoside-triphosphate reductase activating protein
MVAERMMHIAGIMDNDVVDCDDGVCVSLWVSGCSHHCFNCQNKDLWDYEYGQFVPRKDVMDKLIDAIRANGMLRNFSILGGEPLDPKNIANVMHVINRIRQVFGNKIKIYLWTGYTIEYLKKEASCYTGFKSAFDTDDDKDKNYPRCISKILKKIDVLIDGPYKEELRDTSLLLRGSSNQRVLLKKHQYGTRRRQMKK